MDDDNIEFFLEDDPTPEQEAAMEELQTEVLGMIATVALSLYSHDAEHAKAVFDEIDVAYSENPKELVKYIKAILLVAANLNIAVTDYMMKDGK